MRRIKSVVPLKLPVKTDLSKPVTAADRLCLHIGKETPGRRRLELCCLAPYGNSLKAVKNLTPVRSL